MLSPTMPTEPEVERLLTRDAEPELLSVRELKIRRRVASALRLNVTSLVPEGENVLSPVKLCVDPRSARVILPIGNVALVDEFPVVSVRADDPAVVKSCPNASLP